MPGGGGNAPLIEGGPPASLPVKTHTAFSFPLGRNNASLFGESLFQRSRPIKEVSHEATGEHAVQDMMHERNHFEAHLHTSVSTTLHRQQAATASATRLPPSSIAQQQGRFK